MLRARSSSFLYIQRTSLCILIIRGVFGSTVQSAVFNRLLALFNDFFNIYLVSDKCSIVHVVLVCHCGYLLNPEEFN